MTQATLQGPGRDDRSMPVALSFDENSDLVASHLSGLNSLPQFVVSTTLSEMELNASLLADNLTEAVCPD